MIGNDFVEIVSDRLRYCSECGKQITKGQTMLMSIKDGKHRKGVCGEDCRQTFDDRFWQEMADTNARRRSKTA